MYVCVPCGRLVPVKVRRDLELTGDCELFYGCWEQNLGLLYCLGPLQKQQVVVTTDMSLMPVLEKLVLKHLWVDSGSSP